MAKCLGTRLGVKSVLHIPYTFYVDVVLVVQFEKERVQISRQLCDCVYLEDFLEVRWWYMVAFHHHF